MHEIPIFLKNQKMEIFIKKCDRSQNKSFFGPTTHTYLMYLIEKLLAKNDIIGSNLKTENNQSKDNQTNFLGMY